MIAYDTANLIRRHELAARISRDQAAQAHTDLLDLPIEHWPYELVAARARQLRQNLSSYDAAYVALAELSSTTLVTLDRRLAAAPGLRCPVRTP